MKPYWPQKVNKIVAELLQKSFKLAVCDTVTCGKLASVLSAMPNYKNYFAGSFSAINDFSQRSLLDLRGDLKDLSQTKLNNVLRYIDEYSMRGFGTPECSVLVLEYEKENDTQNTNIVIQVRVMGTANVQKFTFVSDSVESLRDSIIDHALEMLVETLMRIPNLKFMEL